MAITGDVRRKIRTSATSKKAELIVVDMFACAETLKNFNHVFETLARDADERMVKLDSK